MYGVNKKLDFLSLFIIYSLIINNQSDSRDKLKSREVRKMTCGGCGTKKKKVKKKATKKKKK